jgi:leucine dehydrogenase
LQACAKHRWGSDDLSGRRIAIQGCGSTGYHLAKELHNAGAELLVTDVDPNRVKRVVDEFKARAVPPEAIFGVQADVFAPCALGGTINDQTIPQLKVEVVVGSANNQLLEPRHGDCLEELGILYAPDYVANAGGIINGCRELLGWDPAAALRKVEEIYETMLTIFTLAIEETVPPYRVADRLAEERLHGAKRGNGITRT